MSISVKEINDMNYGRCVDISNGILNVTITIDYGPRIIKYCPQNMINPFYCDNGYKYSYPQNLSNSSELFYLYGGHRMWVSTENGEKSKYPDNTPVVYSPTAEGVKFSILRDNTEGIILSLDIMLTQETTDIMVVHSVQNVSHTPKVLSVNADTALCKKGFAYSLQGNKDKSISLYNLSKWQDKRLYIADNYVTVDSSGRDEFDIGIKNTEGCCGYVNDNFIFNKRYIHNSKLDYPKKEISTEIKIYNDYISLNTVSPLYIVEAGEIIRHVENWSYIKHNYKADEICGEKFENYIKETE